MRKRSFKALLLAAALVSGLGASVLADTIRLRDGSVIRGQIVGFRDQQFTVLIGSGARGRRSRITLYMEDVESIEFDNATGDAAAAGAANDTTPATSARNDDGAAVYDAERTPAPSSNTRTTPAETRPAPTISRPTTPAPRTDAPSTAAATPQFFQINVRVRADNTTNGWTNSGLVVRRGQRLRINATGRVSLGGGRFSTPTGLPRVVDENKLMRNDPTGGLIAVIGDDNDSFIFVGTRAEFVAERDGILFLGVNEGNLNDNTGNYDAVIEAEALGGSASR